MTKMVELTGRNGVVGKALVDDKDYGRVNRHRWHLHFKGYAWAGIWDRNAHKQRSMLMHRFVLGLETGDGQRVAHLDGNGLNNRKENLRIINVERWRQVTIAVGQFYGEEADRVTAWARSRLFDESGELRLFSGKDDVG